jgi:predicted membrane protein
MFGKLMRAIGLLLLGWFVFVAIAAIIAATRRRTAETPDPKADEVDLVANFGPLEFHSESGAFKGGTVTTWFGGGVLDLRDATLDPGGATIRTSTLFGGGNLVVPETWNVETRVVGLGGVGDARPKVERPADAPTLRLEGTAIFGGWGITSEAPGAHQEEPVTA